MGIKNNSASYAAGLRNGQKILSTSKTTCGDIYYEVEDKDGMKEIKLPIFYKNVTVPQYYNN